jgi:prepilin-type N-terminal cleavage/methylation domain-containing protein
MTAAAVDSGRGAGGFTLLEIIITLVVASLMASILFQSLDTMLRRSSEPVQAVHDGFALLGILEQISADYDRLMAANGASAMQTIRTYIENGNDTSKTPYYGDYIWDTKLITFDAGNAEALAPCASDCSVLKVTVSRADQALTVLFTDMP